MIRSARPVFGILVTMLLVCGCIEPYDPPLNNEDISLIVIDGFLNVSESKATVSITRTLAVKSEEGVPAESGAVVHIENEEGLVYPLTEIIEGVYEGPVPAAGTSSKYRLAVRTRNNREYVSEYVVPMPTPPIDSITYSIVDDGVEFEVTTHDATNKAQNFRWTYLETYEYNANYNSIYQFQGNEVVARQPAESIFTCWRTNRSTDIIIGSTKKLSSSVISKQPLTFIPRESVKLSVKYSLLVQQQTLSDEAYDYWLGLERSTENLGGLFDPLPSEVTGNIRSVTDPGEAVIGFFDAGAIEEQRIFLSRRDLPIEMAGYYRGKPDCSVDSVYLQELPEVPRESRLLVDAIYVMGVGVIGYTVSGVTCVDCRTWGGATVKPTFWK